MDIRNNFLDCGDWPAVAILKNRLGEPVYTKDGTVQSGLAYDPQKNLNPYTCSSIPAVNINTPQNFPDVNFRASVEQFMGVKAGGAFTADEASLKSGTLDCRSKGIKSLAGIQYFTKLTELVCSYNAIDTLDISQNTALQRLVCVNGGLTFLDVSKNVALRYLHIPCNEICSLDISNNPLLIFLECTNNNLTAMDTSNNMELQYLYCAGNQFWSLTVSTNKNLLVLDCESYTGDKQLFWLDISKNTALMQLYCGGNNLEFLDISKNTNLNILECQGNRLRYLNTSNNFALTELDCSSNSLVQLDISKNIDLTKLRCDYVGFSILLDLSNNTELSELYCSSNYFSILDLTKNKKLTKINCSDCYSLSNLLITNNTGLKELDCSRCKISILDVFTNISLTNINCSGNYISSIDNLLSLPNLQTLNVRYNILDCNSWPAVIALKSKLGEPVYNNDYDSSLKSGFSYSPQRGLDPYNCQIGSTTPIPVKTPTNTPTPTMSPTPVPTGLNINTEINFPDSNFRTEIEKFMGINPSGVITAAQAAAKSGTLDVNSKNIANTKGLEFFVNIASFNCSKNKLTSLDVSKNTMLKELLCSDNQITALDVSKNTALEILDCGYNQLTSLDVSMNTAMKKLICDKNQINALDISKNTLLTGLFCRNNQLTKLDVSKNTTLTYFWCESNQLADIDVSRNIVLEDFRNDSNKLSSLDITKNSALKCLWCYSNNLTTLDVSTNLALDYLYCSSNPLTTLDVSRNTMLNFLICDSNQLKTLDVTKNTVLEDLRFENNKITTIDLSKNTSLEYLYCGSNQLTALDVTKNILLVYLFCDSNQLESLAVSKNQRLKILDCSSNNLASISNMLSLPKLQTLDIRKNLLDCEDWADVTALKNKLALPDYLTIDGKIYGVKSGFAYSPQKGLDPYNCQEGIATPTPTPQVTEWKTVDMSKFMILPVEGFQPIGSIQITNIPTDNTFIGATDGRGLKLEIKPGQGTLFLGTMVNLTQSLLELRASVRATSNQVQMGLVAIAVGDTGNPDGSLGYVNPAGNEVPVNQWGEMHLLYDCPAKKFYPAIQFVLPKDSTATQTVYVDNFQYTYSDGKNTTPLQIKTDATFDTIPASLDGLNPFIFWPENLAKGSISLTNGRNKQGVLFDVKDNQAARIGCYANPPQTPAFMESRVWVKREKSEDNGMFAMVILDGEQTIAYYIKANLLPVNEYKELRVAGNFAKEGQLIGPIVILQYASAGKAGKVIVDDLQAGQLAPVSTLTPVPINTPASTPTSTAFEKTTPTAAVKSTPTATLSPVASPVPARTPQTLTVDLPGLPAYAKKLDMVLISAGTFIMGINSVEKTSWGNEVPPHQVTITKPFYLGKFEVTQEQ